MLVIWPLGRKCRDKDIKKIDFRALFTMITLKTSDLFIGNIDKKLSDIAYIENIADDYSQNHKLYVFLSYPFQNRTLF